MWSSEAGSSVFSHRKEMITPFFAFTSDLYDSPLQLLPLRFKDKEEELLYILQICRNIFKRKNVIIILSAACLLSVYAIFLIVAAIYGVYGNLKFSFMYLHIVFVINVFLILMLWYSYRVDRCKALIAEVYVAYYIITFCLWSIWLFIFFTDVNSRLPVLVNVMGFLYATYTNTNINIILYFFAYAPLMCMVTILSCRINYSCIFDFLLCIMKIAIFTTFYLITVKKYILFDNIFMISTTIVSSFFICLIRYMIEFQKRLSFHNWNIQRKQILALKINLNEEKKKKSTLTNIEEIYNIVQDCIENLENVVMVARHERRHEPFLMKKLNSILTILKEDLFSPDKYFLSKKNMHHIYRYILGIDDEESRTISRIFSKSETQPTFRSLTISHTSLKFEENVAPVIKPKEPSEFDKLEYSFLHEKTVNHDIYITLGKHLLDRYYTCHKHVPENIITSLLTEMRDAYNDVPYHNCLHAAMVTHHCHLLVSKLLTADILESNELAAFFIAALGHDIGHFGRTNMFLKNSSNVLSIIYNDRSILENYHSSYLFYLLKKKKNNIFLNEGTKSFTIIRQQIVELILATDMSKHIEILAQFRIKSIETKCHVEQNILLCLKLLIKVADLSHNFVKWEEHLLWVKRLLVEFYSEGDEEKENGLLIIPLFDRKCHDAFPVIQRTFLKEICFPLLNILEQLDPEQCITKCMMAHAQKNYSKWRTIKKNEVIKKKVLQELLQDIPDSWKQKFKPNLAIFQN